MYTIDQEKKGIKKKIALEYSTSTESGITRETPFSFWSTRGSSRDSSPEEKSIPRPSLVSPEDMKPFEVHVLPPRQRKRLIALPLFLLFFFFYRYRRYSGINIACKLIESKRKRAISASLYGEPRRFN